MKKISLLILIGLLVFSGCSISDLGKIKVINDEIDNSKVVILQVLYKSSDQGLTNYKALITYSKKIKDDEPVITAINFKIGTDLKESMLIPKCYIVADEQKYELALFNISSKTDVYTKTYDTLDEKEVHTYTIYVMEGDLCLSSDMMDQMKNSAKLIYRLYLGNRPITFEVSKEDLDLAKTFIDSN